VFIAQPVAECIAHQGERKGLKKTRATTSPAFWAAGIRRSGACADSRVHGDRSLTKFGQQGPAGRAGKPDAKAPAAHSVTEAARAARPLNSRQAIYLVRSTLMTLNDANRSGNYSLLRDLAGPDFQARNSATDLAQDFADLRRRKFDLFATALLDPQFTEDPILDANGCLQPVGHFSTSPLRIRFAMNFQPADEEWRLLSLSLATPPAPTAQSRTSGTFLGVRRRRFMH
jgi:hypothetical protein